MGKNEGLVDRTARVVLGVLLVTAAVLLRNVWLALVATLPLMTGLSGVCPVYRLFGWSTGAGSVPHRAPLR